MSISLESLPPYGFMNDERMLTLNSPVVPAGFTRPDGTPANVSDWTAWVDALAAELAEFLWPTRKNGVWTGAAGARAIELTEADFLLMAQLRPNQRVSIRSRDPAVANHLDCFKVEDADTPPDRQHYAKYDSALSWPVLGTLATAFREGAGLVGPTSLMLKSLFQRPRPYQVAHLAGHATYPYLNAKGATTPSLISGHCVQGCIGGCQMFLAARADLGAPRAVELLQHYAVDVGDRRVFAGVHYPSDNISSWFTALRFCSRVFGPNAGDARKFLWEAISTKSIVHQALSAAVAADAGSPYAEPLKRLADEATAAP